MSAIQMGDKLFLITRKDLLPGVRASQLVHASTEFAKKHPELHHEWFVNSNFVCLLEVKDEDELNLLLAKVNSNDIATAYFREPDRNDEMTAIALGPTAKKLVRHLPLAFK